jgi:HlyD family secretion protein
VTIKVLHRRLIFAGLAAAVLIGGGLGVLWWRRHNQEPHYVTAAVSRGDIQRTVTMTGALNPVVTVQVGSYVSGIVKWLGCDFNTEVKIGQVCAKIDPQPFQMVVDQDRADVATAEAQRKKDQAALAYAKINYERDRKLLEQGIVSQDTVDSDRSNYDQATAQVALDDASILSKKASLRAAEVNLAYTDIVSPVNGTVITRNVDVGQTVVTSLQSSTLFLIGKDLSKMQVDTNVSEADVSSVRAGQKVFFTVQAYPDRTFEGEVTQVRRDPITVQNVVTYDVVVAVDNGERLLLPGMTADTHIITDERSDVLRVPLPAVRFSPTGFRGGHRPAGREEGPSARVWVLREGHLKPVRVTTGLDDGSLIEVSGEGLAAGDRVAVNEARPQERRTAEPQPFRRPGLRF